MRRRSGRLCLLVCYGDVYSPVFSLPIWLVREEVVIATIVEERQSASEVSHVS
jgi:hypothetical protein